jgi:hypothetical protein
MKKTAFVLVIILIFLLAFSSIGLAIKSPPSPTPGGFGIRIPDGSFPLPPALRVPFTDFSFPSILYAESKLNLTEEEREALNNMRVGAPVPVSFLLPWFLVDHILVWSTSDPSVATVNPATGNNVNINPVGQGEAVITVGTEDGSFFFSFIVYVGS